MEIEESFTNWNFWVASFFGGIFKPAHRDPGSSETLGRALCGVGVKLLGSGVWALALDVGLGGLSPFAHLQRSSKVLGFRVLG